MNAGTWITGERVSAVADQRWFPGAPLRESGIVYAKTEHVRHLFTSAGRVSGPLTVILHNSDRSLTAEDMEQKPDTVVSVLAQNCAAPDAVAVPIGLVNSHTPYGNFAAFQRALQGSRRWEDREPKAYLCCTRSTNDERQRVYDMLAGLDWVHAEGGAGIKDVAFADYLANLARFQYAISPPGAGVDCHRTWEALAMGCVPIVRRMPEVARFSGLAMVDQWDDLLTGLPPKPAPAGSDATVQHYWELAGADPSHRRILAFSLWGNDPKYTAGMLENVRLAPRYYPGWTVRIYVGYGTRSSYTLRKAGAEIYDMTPSAGLSGTFWRFLAASSPDVDAVVFRDADSRLNPREAAAVAEWLKSGHAAHVMRDHPHHYVYPILAGMWGIRGGVIQDMHDRIAAWSSQRDLADDQRFLRSVIWPLIEDNCLQHTSIQSKWGGVPFPEHEAWDGKHVGEIIEVEPLSRESVAARARPKRLCPYCGGRGGACEACGGGGILLGRGKDVEAWPITPPNDSPGAADAIHAQERQIIAKRTAWLARGLAIDIGAADGVKTSTTRALVDRGWDVVLFEPSAAGFSALVENTTSPRALCVQAAVIPGESDVPALIPFWLHIDNPRLSTTSPDRAKTSPLAAGFRRCRVAALELAGAHALAARRQVDFLNIDVEGENLALLRSLSIPDWRPRWICVEHQAEPEDAFYAWATRNGYRCVWRSFENLLLEHDEWGVPE